MFTLTIPFEKLDLVFNGIDLIYAYDDLRRFQAMGFLPEVRKWLNANVDTWEIDGGIDHAQINYAEIKFASEADAIQFKLTFL